VATTAAPAHPLRDQVTLLLLNGTAADKVENFCAQKGLDPAAAAELVTDARNRITIAADYQRDEQIGTAVLRLNDLYQKAAVAKPPDHKSALAAQRELNKLLGLYAGGGQAQAPAGGAGDAARAQLDLIDAYLRPLNLCAETYPIEEVARVAAELIRTHGDANV
jgi:hypothetical protein